VPIASDGETYLGALMGHCPKMTSGSSMVLSLTATRGGEEEASVARPDEEVGPSVTATLTDVAASASHVVDVITYDTTTGARDPSLGTTLSVATVTMSIGSTSSGTLLAPDSPGVSVSPEAEALDHKKSLLAQLKRNGNKKQA
jgi:hypothetical protein